MRRLNVNTSAVTRHHVRIPGKTFLLGEYLALEGGPSIVISTEPCFEFSWESEVASDKVKAGRSKGSPIHHPFHRESPAGQWLNSAFDGGTRETNLEHVIQFKDPFDGKGGFGASTAEFAGAWVFRNMLKNPDEWNANGPIVASLGDHRETVVPRWPSERIGSNRFRDILDDYRATTATGSGADLVSQVAGGIAVWNARIDEMRRFRWPFSDLSFTLLMTGKKLATHRHLSGLATLGANVVEEMRSWVEDAIQSFALEDADRLIASVRGFGKILDVNGRLADHSRTLLRELADCSGIRAAKGCGAMGSDVLLVLHDRSAVAHIAEFSTANGLVKAASCENIWASGLCLQREDIERVGHFL